MSTRDQSTLPVVQGLLSGLHHHSHPHVLRRPGYPAIPRMGLIQGVTEAKTKRIWLYALRFFIYIFFCFCKSYVESNEHME